LDTEKGTASETAPATSSETAPAITPLDTEEGTTMIIKGAPVPDNEECKEVYAILRLVCLLL
jgi:hypothetical protein